MPKPKKPSKFFPETITKSNILKDKDFESLLMFFPEEKQQVGFSQLKEIFESVFKSKTLLERQKNSSNPSAIKIYLNDLKNALRPFNDPEFGVDYETYDLINENVKNLNNLIDKRLIDLDALKLNGGLGPEHATYFASFLHVIFDHNAIDKTEKSRRNFLALALDLAKLGHPDKDSSRTKFDRQFMVRVQITHKYSTKGTASAKFGQFFVPTRPR